jgi:hypothetical protein
MSRFKKEVSQDLWNLLTDPCFDNSESLWRRVTEWKDQYPGSWNSLERNSPILLEILNTILRVGNEMGWEEEYYANRTDLPSSRNEPESSTFGPRCFADGLA